VKTKMTVSLALELLPPEQADELRQIDKQLAKLNDKAIDLSVRRWELLNSVKPLDQRYKPKDKEN